MGGGNGQEEVGKNQPAVNMILPDTHDQARLSNSLVGVILQWEEENWSSYLCPVQWLQNLSVDFGILCSGKN